MYSWHAMSLLFIPLHCIPSFLCIVFAALLVVVAYFIFVTQTVLYYFIYDIVFAKFFVHLYCHGHLHHNIVNN